MKDNISDIRAKRSRRREMSPKLREWHMKSVAEYEICNGI